MREILFRGKRMDNGKWAEGYLYEHEPALVGIVSENDVPESSKWFIARTGFADWNMPRPVEFVEIDPSTVGQYTGLKDKNGKRIFEGDIVKTDKFSEPNKQYIIKYDLQFGAFIGQDRYNCYFVTFDGDSDEFEVIGNIHDNPKLLKGGDEE